MQYCKKYSKVLKAFNILKNVKYVGYQHGLASMVYKFFDENSTIVNTSAVAIKSELMLNQQLAEELHIAIIRKFKKPKIYSSFKDNIWSAGQADTTLPQILKSMINSLNLQDLVLKTDYLKQLKNLKNLNFSKS